MTAVLSSVVSASIAEAVGAPNPAAQFAALPGSCGGEVYARTMGRHDADPAGGRRYTAVVLVSVLIAILLIVGFLALRGLAHS
jgi:hypothetical protein